MNYYPLNYSQINAIEGCYSPSMVKSFNNQTFAFWARALFQRAHSVIIADWYPDDWDQNVKDFFWYCVLRFGHVAYFNDSKFGDVFQPGNPHGINFYYQPTDYLIANPQLNRDLEIGKDCELIKLTPDWMGIYDVVVYYAEKLSSLDGSVNMSIINSRFAWLLGARNKGMAEALKKMVAKISKGEPVVIYDQKIVNDTKDKDVPYQFLERSNLKQSYITTDLLMDRQTLIDAFDAEIGITTVPYQKKERMVTSEAESKKEDSTSRVNLWVSTLNGSVESVNKMFGTKFHFRLREEDESNGKNDNVRFDGRE